MWTETYISEEVAQGGCGLMRLTLLQSDSVALLWSLSCYFSNLLYLKFTGRAVVATNSQITLNYL